MAKKSDQANSSEIISYWPHLIENFQYSPLEFYSLIEQAIANRKVPDVEISRVDLREGGLLSPRRTYLRVKRERLHFDVCAAPVGTGFFVSSRFWEKSLRVRWDVLLLLLVGGLIAWQYCTRLNYTPVFVYGGVVVLGVIILIAKGLLSASDNCLIQIPVIGFIYEIFLRTLTYYRVDIIQMYQQATHAALMEVIDQITQAKGIAPISELTRKPIMRKVFNRR